MQTGKQAVPVGQYTIAGEQCRDHRKLSSGTVTEADHLERQLKRQKNHINREVAYDQLAGSPEQLRILAESI